MRFFQHTRKTKRKKKRKTKAKGKQIRSVMRTTIKKKPRKITSSIQPKHCDHLSKLYTKWENLHNTIFNHVETLSPKEIEDLQKKAADTIIKKDLDITPTGNYNSYKRFLQSIKKCNDIKVLKKMKQFLMQIQTGDTIQFSDIEHEIGTCKHKDRCYRDNKIHKSLYHNEDDFTLVLIELLLSRIHALET